MRSQRVSAANWKPAARWLSSAASWPPSAPICSSPSTWNRPAPTTSTSMRWKSSLKSWSSATWSAGWRNSPGGLHPASLPRPRRPRQQLSLFGEPVTRIGTPADVATRLITGRYPRRAGRTVRLTWHQARPDRLRYRNDLHRPHARRSGGHFTFHPSRRGLLHPGRAPHRRAAAAHPPGDRSSAPGDDRPGQSQDSATT